MKLVEVVGDRLVAVVEIVMGMVESSAVAKLAIEFAEKLAAGIGTQMIAMNWRGMTEEVVEGTSFVEPMGHTWADRLPSGRLRNTARRKTANDFPSRNGPQLSMGVFSLIRRHTTP